MKLIVPLVLAAVVVAGAANVLAGVEPEKVIERTVVVTVETDDFVIEDADLSHLGVGDAETIVTESGKTVDLLRTEEGIEIYVDGELVDTGGAHDGRHIVHEIRIVCDEDEENCGDLTAMAMLEDIEVETLHEDSRKFIVIGGEGEEIDFEALGEGAHEMHGTVHIVKEGEDLEFGELHEAHDGDVIIIRKEIKEEI